LYNSEWAIAKTFLDFLNVFQADAEETKDMVIWWTEQKTFFLIVGNERGLHDNCVARARTFLSAHSQNQYRFKNRIPYKF
jgi:hypothetical protein